MKNQVTLLLREYSKLKIKAAWSELNVKLPKLKFNRPIDNNAQTDPNVPGRQVCSSREFRFVT